jgi:LuxR family maltose regulon positive regulatory protein
MIDLLTTKLFFPAVRPHLVARPSLVEKVEEGLKRQLTLIAAPAGYGKTTLMSEWHSTLGRDTPAAWLSLEADDNDSGRFWFYLISASATLQRDLGNNALKMLDTPQLIAVESLLTVLINDLSKFTGDFVLSLDDFHLITEPEIFRGIDFLIEHMPPNMHLVLLTRADPPLALSRLRARGQLAEIRARDLSFNTREAATLFNEVSELALSPTAIAALENRTEGWIAGLQLAALSLQGRDNVNDFITGFSGSHHYIADYLLDEVLNRLPETINDFLLKTSILERLTGDLCDSLTGGSNGQTSLEVIHRLNLFISPLDDEHCWYRYHQLFSELLCNRLRKAFPDELPTLYHRAAAWFETSGNLVEAINYYLHAREFQLAANLIKLGINRISSYQSSIQSYNLTMMLHWLGILPEHIVKDDPKLSLLYAQSAWLLGRRTELDPYFQDAQLSYDRLVSKGQLTSDDPGYSSIPFDILVGRSMSAVYAGNFNQAIELAEEALSTPCSENQPGLEDAYISLYLAYRELGQLDKAIKACDRTISISQKSVSKSGVVDGLNSLGFMFQIQGELKRSSQVYHQALQYAHHHNLTWMASVPITYIRLGHLHYHWNDLARAEEFFDKCFALCEQYDNKMIFTYGQIFLARLKCAQGKEQEALETIQKVEKTALQEQISAFDIELESHKAWIQSRLGNQASAAAWLEKIDLRIGEQLGIWQGIQAVQAAHVLVALNRIDEALLLARRIEESARASGSLTCQIEAMVIQAVASLHLGERSKAHQFLLESISLAEPEGYKQIFLNEGKPMIDLLLEARPTLTDPRCTDFINQLLGAFPSHLPDSGFQYSSKSGHPGDQLSERDLEVLNLIATGFSNQEIADELVIALGTVKRHNFNIYSKLGVKSRTECLAKARILHLVN